MGQGKLPDLSSTTSHSEDVIAQINILEDGLCNGGHVGCLIGIWNEMALRSLKTAESRGFCWSRSRQKASRLFVNIHICFTLRFLSIVISKSFFYSFQSLVIYTFRELLDYCVISFSVTNSYSLSVKLTPTDTHVFLNFWSGNVYDQTCLGCGRRRLLMPKNILVTISSFINLFETAPSCVSVFDCNAKLETCLIYTLPRQLQPSALCSFGADELERCQAVSTAKILEGHDFRTVLDFFLMKLRTELDKDCRLAIPVLHKVILFSHHLVRLLS